MGGVLCGDTAPAPRWGASPHGHAGTVAGMTLVTVLLVAAVLVGIGVGKEA
jgi:hypothetical protein